MSNTQSPVDAYTSEDYWTTIWHQTSAGNVKVWEADPAIRQQGQLIGVLIDDLLKTRDHIDVLEVGCANSFWLPHLGRSPRVRVYGLDYSHLGCHQARYQLDRRRVRGNIWCQEFFSFANSTTAHFDLLIAFGFIEHFDDPTLALRGMYRLLRPGGYLFVTVPNLIGIYGALQQRISRSIYDGHVLMNHQQLQSYTERAGFEKIQTGYTGGALYLSLLNFYTTENRFVRMTRAFLPRAVRAFDIAIGTSLEVVGLNQNNEITSPYVYAIGQRPRI